MHWTTSPSLHAAISGRDVVARPERGGEHAVDVAFTQQKDVAAQFAPLDTISDCQRRLPVGIFNSAVRRDSLGSDKKSQIDL